MAPGFRRCTAASITAVLWGLTVEAQSLDHSVTAGGPPPAPTVPASCITGDSLLDTPAMRELMRTLWAFSNPYGWPDERAERAGFMFDSAGVLVYRMDLESDNTPCRSSCVVPITGRPLAAVMTHPFRPGDLLPASCSPADGELKRYDVSRFGGASELDLIALHHWGTPGYILDHESVYAIPAGTTSANARHTIKRYPRVDVADGCELF